MHSLKSVTLSETLNLTHLSLLTVNATKSGEYSNDKFQTKHFGESRVIDVTQKWVNYKVAIS